jgi:putative phosphoesterase
VLVAVIGDTHLPRGSRRLPEECVRRLRRADLIVHTGDHSSLASLHELRALGPPVHAVHGNADEPALQELLPEELVVEVEEATIGVTHVPGPREGREERLLRRFPSCDAVLYGHTHEPQVERRGRVWILNPGSPTERRRSPARTMLELDVRGRELEPTLIRLP